MLKIVRGLYHKLYSRPKVWLKEFGCSNISNPKKFFRGLKWAVLPKYKKFAPFIIIDPIVNCNLECPLCSIPPKILPHFGEKLSLENFETTLRKVKKVTNNIFFCHAGEPFLNKNLLDMVALVNKENMFSLVGTNGTFLNDKNIDNILKSGLDYLHISFDGFSKETFEKYRVGANFDKVKEGIVKLHHEKKKRKLKKPFISVTFLVNAYNSHEIDKTAVFFKELGIEFIPKGINLNIHRRKDDKQTEDLSHWIETESKYSIYRKNANGELTYRAPFKPTCDTCEKPVINCKGEILLCCHDIFNSVKLANIEDVDLKDFWLSEKYTNIRKLASERKLPLCKVCGK